MADATTTTSTSKAGATITTTKTTTTTAQGNGRRLRSLPDIKTISFQVKIVAPTSSVKAISKIIDAASIASFKTKLAEYIVKHAASDNTFGKTVVVKVVSNPVVSTFNGTTSVYSGGASQIVALSGASLLMMF